MLLPLVLLSGFLASLSNAIENTNPSSCASDCGGGLTFFTDLECNDNGYDNTNVGRNMKSCLLCESTSTAYNSADDNDMWWFLFNMKYSIQYCLLDNDNLTAAATSCIDDCQPLKSVYDASWFTVPRPGQYDYCDINGGAFGTYADGCITCLQGVEGSVVLGNFMSTMQSACKDKPNSTDNDTINLPRKLFETATVASSQTAAASSSGTAIASASSLKGSTLTAAPTSSSTSSSQSSSSSQGSSSSGLSSGAAAGIGVGAGIVALAAIGGLTWYLLRRRRRRSAVTELRAISEKDTGVFTNPPQHLASTPLVEADGCYNSDGAKIKSGGAWRAELPST